ncbi:MAG TPA: EscU/YscU/HrcU family type III secretion system export apparatus switch protein [Myxococcales bacterium]|nr:EscU/YscU/HrcU family type III secretion system export apparatus switch protein [Myxococcales bacterium]
MSEKTEQPTHRRLEDARKKGNVARSKAWSGGAVTLAGLAAFIAAAPAGSARLVLWTQRVLAGVPLGSPVAAAAEGARALAFFVAPPLAAAFLSALVTSAALSGLRFTPELLLPRADRLAPSLRKVVSAQALLGAGKGLLAAAAVLAVAWVAGKDGLGALVGAVRGEPVGAALGALGWAKAVALRASAAVGVLAVLDFALARRRHGRELMMTREEVKNEHKQSEGDPHHKHQRKAMHRQLAAGGPERGVRAATAVVVNPTHVAVALRYRPEECDAPYLVARGLEADALALRREAERLRIPVVRDVPLARSLVQFDVGMEIPEELYEAAAAVLAAALDAGAATAPARNRSPRSWT